MHVLFTCKLCGIKHCKVLVRLRAANEEIEHYMDMISLRVGMAHELRAPLCQARQFDLAIPIKQDTTLGIGMEEPGYVPPPS